MLFLDYEIIKEIGSILNISQLCAFSKFRDVMRNLNNKLLFPKMLLTISYIQGPLIGRESEISQLPEYPATARMSALQVMSVCGIPGAGKSALVRNLYRSKMSQNNQYKNYIWVDVYHPFNLVDFCKSILIQFHSRFLKTGEDPVKTCHGLLKDQQCLLVIDNLQSTEDWDLIRGALAIRSAVNTSSRNAIVVITNEERIALHCADRKDLVFHVKPLEAGAAIDLFKKKVHLDRY